MTTAEKFTEILQAIKTVLENKKEPPEAVAKITKGFPKLFAGLADDYKNSDGFMTYLCSFLESLKNWQRTTGPNIFAVMKPFVGHLKAHQLSMISQNQTTETANGSVSQAVLNGNAANTSGSGSVRQQRRLDEVLEKASRGLDALEDEIKRAGEEGLSMGDLDKEDNAFGDLLKLKSKYVKTSASVARLRKEPISVRPPPVLYSGSGHDAIDKAITKLIRPPQNQALSTIAFVVPAYDDIRSAVQQTNDSQKLGLTKDEVEEVVKKVGTEVSILLKAKTRRRIGEYISDLIETHTTEEIAPTDPELEAKLKQNEAIHKRELEQVQQTIDRHGEIDDANADALPGDECKESEESDEDADDQNVIDGQPSGASYADLVDVSNEEIQDPGASDPHNESTGNIFSIMDSKRKSEATQDGHSKKAKNETEAELVCLSDDD